MRTVVLLEAKATKSAILQELKTLAADSAPADAIVFFFAGRGLILSGRFCLVPHDAETGILQPQTGRHRRVLPCDDILDTVGDARALKRLVIFDTRMPVRRNDNAEAPDSGASLCGAVERMSRTHGVYTIAALTADETAHAIERLGHGVLTHAMLAGVGAADAQPIKRRFVLPVNPEQMVDARDWLSIATEEVDALSEPLFGARRRVQVANSSPEGSFPVVKLTAPGG